MERKMSSTHISLANLIGGSTNAFKNRIRCLLSSSDQQIISEACADQLGATLSARDVFGDLTYAAG
jgi:hypothetical protein